MVVGGGSKWWWVVVVGGGRWWCQWTKHFILYLFRMVLFEVSNTNKNIGWQFSRVWLWGGGNPPDDPLALP